MKLITLMTLIPIDYRRDAQRAKCQEGMLLHSSPRDHTIEASAGTTVFVSAGVAHTYYEAVGPTRYLIIMTPRLRELITALQHH